MPLSAYRPRRPLFLQKATLRIRTTTRTGSPIHHGVWALLLATMNASDDDTCRRLPKPEQLVDIDLARERAAAQALDLREGVAMH